MPLESQKKADAEARVAAYERMRRLERAALQLATAICPQEVHCQACRNKASLAIQESAERITP